MTTRGPRLLWPDVAKGLCILLVVLHHVTSKQYPAVSPASLEPLVDSWVALTYALKPVRVPLFFVLSGFFAASTLDRPWPAALRRVATSGYLYVVWLVLLFGFFAVERTLATNRTQNLDELVRDLLWPSTGIWFLWALGAYLLVLRALRGVPDTWVIAGGVLLALAGSWLPIAETNRISVVFHFVFFAVGALRPGLVRRLALAPIWLVVIVPVFAVLAVVAASVDVPRSIELLGLSMVGVPLGLSLAVALARVPWIAGPVSWAGRRTLPVYVMHMPLLAVLVHLPIGLGSGSTPGSQLATVAYPLLATAFVAGGCLALQVGLTRSGMGWLFALPTPLSDRLTARVISASTTGAGVTREPRAAGR